MSCAARICKMSQSLLIIKYTEKLCLTFLYHGVYNYKHRTRAVSRLVRRYKSELFFP